MYLTPEYEEHQQALTSGVKVQFQGDDIDKPNEAWLWAHRFQPCELCTEPRSEFRIGEGLRRFGYGSWDSSQLHDSQLLLKERV